ncbi:MAG: DUF5683 domain-containing protein [Muribaculaceae bacterium]|nr:DUF5683 domain-containing protein [Muribaculaceae bacterium]
MKNHANVITSLHGAQRLFLIAGIILLILATPFNVFSNPLTQVPDSIPMGAPVTEPVDVVEKEITLSGDSTIVTPVDTLAVVDGPVAMAQEILPGSQWDQEWVERPITFNPDPTRAVWLSALFPGLGQVYNRRYWKLPLIVGGYLGLGYATSWNNSMLKDYTQAFADITDNDPSTNSYMNFFPSTVDESSLDKTWLTNTLRSRKNFYRRNRDLCVIAMVGVYILAMVDAYVDASLAHFDISPDLSMDIAPAVMIENRNNAAVGLQWAFRF